MKTHRSRRNASAFTLVELVISGALMSMILASAYVCLRGGLASRKLIESRADLLQSARVALNLITADLHGACPLSKDMEFLGMHRQLGDAEADNLDFGTHNYSPRGKYESDFCEVSYFLDRHRESGTLSLWRRRDPTPDEEPLAGGNREEIARGLRGLRFEYYDGFEWFDEWGDPEGRRQNQNSVLDPGNLSGLPEAVRITLWFATESKPAREVGSGTATNEPPLVFQTVARLNLAASSSGGSSSGSSSGSSGNSTSGASPGQRSGGRN